MSAAYWTMAILTLVGTGVMLGKGSGPRDPMTPGGLIVAVLVNGLLVFLLMSAALR
jgi:amino acid permease